MNSATATSVPTQQVGIPAPRIVTTATRTHLIHPDAVGIRLVPNSISPNNIRTLVACGARVDGVAGTHESGALADGITCAACRRTQAFATPLATHRSR